MTKDSDIEKEVQKRRDEMSRLQYKSYGPPQVTPKGRRTLIQQTTHTNTIRPRYHFNMD